MSSEEDVQVLVLRHMIDNEQFLRTVAPHVVPNPDYFEGPYRNLFTSFAGYFAKYNRAPSEQELLIALKESKPNEHSEYAIELLPHIYEDDKVSFDWLIDTTEEWCRDRAIMLSVIESLDILEGKSKTLTKNAIPGMLQKAISVSFDNSIGHNYFDDADKRFAFYHEDKNKLPFDIEMLNRITKGGVGDKTLNVVAAGTNVGKSIFLCHLAASYMKLGHDVLYVTLEMSEEETAQRIDANLMNITMDDVLLLKKTDFFDRIKDIHQRGCGRLIIREYPTSQANANHLRALLRELEMKQKFKPRVVLVDYLNIMACARMKMAPGGGTYTYVKFIAEELRGLASETNIPFWTATQLNRQGHGSSDPDLEDQSESFGVPQTADFYITISATEQMEAQGIWMVKQQKSRYGPVDKPRRFAVGINKACMRLYDVPENAYAMIDENYQPQGDDKPVFDNSESGDRIGQEKPDLKLDLLQ